MDPAAQLHPRVTWCVLSTGIIPRQLAVNAAVGRSAWATKMSDPATERQYPSALEVFEKEKSIPVSNQSWFARLGEKL
jgi:hypothetical protein